MKPASTAKPIVVDEVSKLVSIAVPAVDVAARVRWPVQPCREAKRGERDVGDDAVNRFRGA